MGFGQDQFTVGILECWGRPRLLWRSRSSGWASAATQGLCTKRCLVWIQCFLSITPYAFKPRVLASTITLGFISGISSIKTQPKFNLICSDDRWCQMRCNLKIRQVTFESCIVVNYVSNVIVFFSDFNVGMPVCESTLVDMCNVIDFPFLVGSLWTHTKLTTCSA